MKRFSAQVAWSRQGPPTSSGNFPSGHLWSFDGGAKVYASSSPLSMPEPFSVPTYVDPEEALVAAASSCHMMFFLFFAHKAGHSVLSYEDSPEGIMDRTDRKVVAFTRILLNPTIRFEGGEPPPQEIAALHKKAHANCFIANSLTADVEIAG